jgi:hypothetical protein
MFEKSGNLSLLRSIGRQGAPAAREYLAKLAMERGNDERRRFAFGGLSDLYKAQEAAGDEEEMAKVRETIYKVYDQDNKVAAFNPRLLAVIVHQGTIDRLEQMLDQVRGDARNEVARVLDECYRKLAKGQKGR